MMILWMAYALLIASVSYVAAMPAEHLFWLWRWPRRAAWISALIIATAIPLAMPAWHSMSRVSAIVTAPAAATAPRSLTVNVSRPPRATNDFVSSAPAHTTITSSVRRWTERAEPMLIVTWPAASFLLLLLALLSYTRLARQSAAWPRVIVNSTCALVSPSCGPAVFGIWKQRIIVPRWALSLDDRAQALMLRHEREHLRTRDPQLLLIAFLAALLFPWNVALWLIVRRLRLAIEVDCDDRVLRIDDDARAYGSLLLTVSARRTREMRFAVALAERSSMLERRIKAMTAVRPHRSLLLSIPLLVAITLLSVAAARTPTPQLPLLRHQKPVAVAHLPRLASPESLPRITVSWENASIGDVLAAFARFAHRRITADPHVDITVSGAAVDEPWLDAMKRIMSAHGLSVDVKPDSSIYISPQHTSERHSMERSAAARLARTVSGTVEDAQTGAPITSAHIGVVGTQLVGSANETWSDDSGRFAMRVPDGEVWLDACAPGYDFTRVTLGSLDSAAIFRGTRSEASQLKDGTEGQTPSGATGSAPVLIVDGLVINGATQHCPSRPALQYYFKLF